MSHLKKQPVFASASKQKKADSETPSAYFIL